MAKHKYIRTPQRMWELFCLYREEIKSNPIKITEQKKGTVIIPKDFTGNLPDSIIELPAQRPLTIEGFENYCADLGIINDLGDYFSNKNSKYSKFSTICSRIKRTIRQDQIEGGMAGIYNPSITQRLNGLTEKNQTELTTDGSFNVTLNLNNTSVSYTHLTLPTNREV